MENGNERFLNLVGWHEVVDTVLFAVAILAPLAYVIYVIVVLNKRGFKQKYDFVGKNEQRVLKLINIFISIGLFSLFSRLNKGDQGQTVVHLIVLVVVGAVAMIAYIYFSFLFVDVYYPRVLANRLRRLRYKPRKNPKTGNLMKLLSEEEEDKYLDEGMRMEESVFSVDYDVWLDQQTGDTIVEKYAGNLTAAKCNNCNFQTLKLVKEEVLEEDELTDGQERHVKQLHRCSYCKSETEEIVSMKKKEVQKDPVSDALSRSMQKEIQTVKVYISTTDGSDKVYDFQTAEQANSFLSEYVSRKDTPTESI